MGKRVLRLRFATLRTNGAIVQRFLYFMLTDPDKLQSEEYQIKARVLEYIEEKGGVSEEERRVIEAISNPQEGQLSNRIEEDQ